MKNLMIAIVAACGLAFSAPALKAADEKKESGAVTGVLIDSKCAAGKDETASAKHPKSCTIKCAKEQGLHLVTGEKHLKLDEKGAELASAYLAKEGSTTKVVVTGAIEGDTIKVTDIKPVEEKESKEKDAK